MELAYTAITTTRHGVSGVSRPRGWDQGFNSVVCIMCSGSQTSRPPPRVIESKHRTGHLTRRQDAPDPNTVSDGPPRVGGTWHSSTQTFYFTITSKAVPDSGQATLGATRHAPEGNPSRYIPDRGSTLTGGFAKRL